jgi:hypothetical protein
MAVVSVLTAVGVDLRKIGSTLAGEGYDIAQDAAGYVISREARRIAVRDATRNLPDLSDRVIRSATELLGRAPRFRVDCVFDDTAEDRYGRAMAVQVAQAVAGHVPLAVFDDHAGTTSLVHPRRGLVGPEEYQAMRRANPVADLFRRFFGAGG